MEEFQYDPLDLGRRSIRILRLFAGSRSYIECEIFEARLFQEDSVPFEALSYVWGSLEKSYSIQLNGKRLAVTKNLYVALRHMRFKKKDRILWIDAICIDQNNAKERGHQVQQMGDIFSQAEQVIFWLGHGTLDVDLLMAALKRLERSSHRNSCNGWLLSDKRWLKLWSETQFPLTEVVSTRMRQGLQELFQRPWFTRVWILQEVAKAKRAVVCAGNEMVGSRIFTLAPTLVNVHPDMHCQAVLDIMPGQSRRSSWWSEKRNLCTLLQKFPRSRASDSRDRIFALIGIASDGEENHLLKPDYTKPVEELIRDAELFFFGKVLHPYRTMQRFMAELPTMAMGTFLKIASKGNPKEMMYFLDHQDKSFTISPDCFEAAAENEMHGVEIMKILYAHSGVHVDGGLTTAAIHNFGCGSELLGLFITLSSPEVKQKIAEELIHISDHAPDLCVRHGIFLRDYDAEIYQLMKAAYVQHLRVKIIDKERRSFLRLDELLRNPLPSNERPFHRTLSWFGHVDSDHADIRKLVRFLGLSCLFCVFRAWDALLWITLFVYLIRGRDFSLERRYIQKELQESRDRPCGGEWNLPFREHAQLRAHMRTLWTARSTTQAPA